MAQQRKQTGLPPGVFDEGGYYRVRIRKVIDGRRQAVAKWRYPYLTTAQGASPAAAKQSKAQALLDATAQASKERAALHYHGAPLDTTDDAQTMRAWFDKWEFEALEYPGFDAATKKARLKETEAPSIAPQAHPVKDKRLLKRARAIAEGKLDTPIKQLTQSDFAAMLNDLTGRKGPAKTATKKRMLYGIFAMVWNHARDYWEKKDFPRAWEGLKFGEEKEEGIGRALTEEEIAKIELELSRLEPDTRACIVFLRNTAMRRAEACRLRHENITWPGVAGHVAVAELKYTKAKKGQYRGRSVYLQPEAMAAIQALYPAGVPAAGFVFHSPTEPENPIPPDTVSQAWKRCVKAAGVKHARLQDLRHTGITEMSANPDLTQQQVMKQVGHKTEQAHEIYKQMSVKTGRTLINTRMQPVSAIVAKNKEALTDALKALSPKERAEIIAAAFAQDSEKK